VTRCCCQTQRPRCCNSRPIHIIPPDLASTMASSHIFLVGLWLAVAVGCASAQDWTPGVATFAGDVSPACVQGIAQPLYARHPGTATDLLGPDSQLRCRHGGSSGKHIAAYRLIMVACVTPVPSLIAPHCCSPPAAHRQPSRCFRTPYCLHQNANVGTVPNGACGFGPIAISGPRSGVAGISHSKSTLAAGALKGCGQCVEIRCTDKEVRWGPSQTQHQQPLSMHAPAAEPRQPGRYDTRTTRTLPNRSTPLCTALLCPAGLQHQELCGGSGHRQLRKVRRQPDQPVSQHLC
jgi:hypothetical protein